MLSLGALPFWAGSSYLFLYFAAQLFTGFTGSNGCVGRGLEYVRAYLKYWACLLFLALGVCAPSARADVAILLEEPYSLDGTLAGTGHAAVYLSNICADAPTKLRRCNPGEYGIVLSRYHHLGGYDWVAIPTIAYLYAVEKPQDIPLFVDPKLAWFLRNQYRRRHLAEIAPDPPSLIPDTRDWYQLIGSAFDRALYGFQLPTTQEADDRLIARFNYGQNKQAYKLVTDNCADFVHDVVTFYYPDSVWRSKLGDLGVMTPKQAAKSLVQFSKRAGKRDPEIKLNHFLIPQVPGTIKRSKPVHGLVDGVFHSKKYFLPLAVFEPFVAGGVATTYYLGGRFDPGKGAVLWTPEGAMEKPLSKDEQRTWQRQFEQLVRSDPSLKSAFTKTAWQPLESSSEFHLDAEGAPIIQIPSATGAINLGTTRANILSSQSQAQARVLLAARLRDELRGGRTHKTSASIIRSDFSLLQQSLPSSTLSAASGGN